MPHRHTTSTLYVRFYFLLHVSAIHTDSHEIEKEVQEEKCYRKGALFLILKISESNLITVQQDATYSVYYISVGSCTCFGC